MSRRGFTLTEMTVVIALLSLFAAAIVPNLASQQAGLARRAMYADIQKIVLTARDTAIESNRRVVLRYDDAERALLLETENDDGDVEATADRVPLMEGVQPEDFVLGRDSVSPGEWAMAFYPDGTSDGGGLSVSDDGRIRSFEVTRSGHLRVLEGEMSDPTMERWQAGDNEQRI